MISQSHNDAGRGNVASVAWLEQRMEAGRLRYNVSMALRLALWAAALLILVLFAYGTLDFLVRFPALVRLAATTVLLAAFALHVVRAKRRFLRRIETVEEVARQVERVKARQGQTQHSLLIAAIEFGQRLKIPGSNSLKNEAIRLARERCVNPARVNLYDPLFTRRLRRAVGPAILALLFAFGWAPQHAAVFLARMAGLNVGYPTATRLAEVRYEPHAPVRMDYPIAVRVEGRLPGAGALRVFSDGGGVFSLPLEAAEGESGLYHALLATPIESFAFSFRLGDYRSQRYTVTLRPPPRVAEGAIEVHPPAYTGQEPRKIHMGSLDVPEGSRVAFRVKPTTPVASCVLAMGDTNIAMRAADDGYECEMVADRSTPFQARLVDVFGIENREEARHFLSVVRDTPPSVEIVRPGADTFRSNLSRVQFAVAAQDDYALDKVTLRYVVYRSTSQTRTSDDDEKPVGKGEIEVPGADGRRDFARPLMLAVRDFQARAGDRVAVSAVARERRTGEPRETISREVSVFLVSDEELRAIIERERLQVDRLLVKLRDDEKRHWETLGERIKP